MRNFLCDGHTVAIVDDIEYAELAVALQNVSNEVYRPGDIFLVRGSTLRVRLDVSEMLSRLQAGFISLLFILAPLDVEFSFSTKEPRFHRLKNSDRLTLLQYIHLHSMQLQ